MPSIPPIISAEQARQDGILPGWVENCADWHSARASIAHMDKRLDMAKRHNTIADRLYAVAKKLSSVRRAA